MTPEQAIEAAKLAKLRKNLLEKLREIEGRLERLGVDVDEGDAK